MKKAKQILALALVFILLAGTAAFADEPVFTERKGKGVEAWLWEELSQYSPSDVVTAGVLSYFWRESQYRSDAVAGWASSLAGYGIDLCETVTEETDKGLDDGSSRSYFIRKARRYGGYGLGQWRNSDYLGDLYDFAQDYGTSVGDAKMQCAYIFESLRDNRKLWKKLRRCLDPERAGRLIAIYYDGSQSGAPYMGYKAGRLYEKYHEADA